MKTMKNLLENSLRHLAETHNLTCIEIEDVQQLAQAYISYGKSTASAYEIGAKTIRAIARQHAENQRREGWAKTLTARINRNMNAAKIIAARRIKKLGGLPSDQDNAALAAFLSMGMEGKSAIDAVHEGVQVSLFIMKLNGRLQCA